MKIVVSSSGFPQWRFAETNVNFLKRQAEFEKKFLLHAVDEPVIRGLSRRATAGSPASRSCLSRQIFNLSEGPAINTGLTGKTFRLTVKARHTAALDPDRGGLK